MMNLFNKYLVFLSIAIALVFTGCKDNIDPEITLLETNRLFSPINLEVRVVNKTSLRFTWAAVEKAQKYSIEVYENSDEDFSGTPIRVVQNILYDQLPYIITGLAGETTYSVRVQALGEDIEDSKWISTTISTDPEQIFFAVNPEEITAFTVTLRWPAESEVTAIVILPDSLVFNLTHEQQTAGQAEITGLNSETEYSARLLNVDKRRGLVTFTTLIDIGDAVLITPEDELISVIEAAKDGDSFALMPGEYIINDNIVIDKSIEIIGVRPYDKPILAGVVLRMKGGAGLKLKDLVFDGSSASDGNQTIIYDEVLPAGETYGDIEISGCEISNYVKGVFYASNAVLIESVTIINTLYSNVECVGGDFIDFRSGMTKKFDFINNTVFNCALNRDLFRMDNATNFSGDNHCVLTVENCTFYNIISAAGTTRRVLYVRLASHQIFVRRCIFAETAAIYSNQAATTVAGMSDNNYYNAPGLVDPSQRVFDAWIYTTLDPGFADPTNGNLKLSNEDLIYKGIGDPRWRM